MSFSLTQKTIIRIVMWQGFILIFAALFAALMMGKNTGLALFLGGLAFWIPTVLFAGCVFYVVQTPGIFLLLFILGEVFRLVCAAILFIVVVVYFSMKIVPALLGFIVAIMAFWVASIGFLINQKGIKLS